MAAVERHYRVLIGRRAQCLALPESVQDSCLLTAANAFAMDLRDEFGDIETFGPGGLDATVSASRPVTRDILDGRVFSWVANEKRGIAGSAFVVFGWNGTQHEAIVVGLSQHPQEARLVVDGSLPALMDLEVVDGVWLHHATDGRIIATELAANIFHGTSRPGDWNRDRAVNSDDLLAFFGSFERRAPRADLDGNGDFDRHDVQVLLDLMR